MRLIKSIPSLTFLCAVTVLLIMTVAMFGKWVPYHYEMYRQQIGQMEAQLLARQEQLLKDQVDRAVDYIDFMRSQTEKRLKDQIKSRVDEACDLAMNIYRENQDELSREKLEKLVKDALRPVRFNHGRGYYFATRMDGIEMLFADRPEMEGRNMLSLRDLEGRFVVRDMIDIVMANGEGFYRYEWTKPGHDAHEGFSKIAFVKLFKPFGWLIGTGEYLDDVESGIKTETIKRLEAMHFAKDGYVFAGRYDGVAVTRPGKGRNLLDLTDSNGVKITQELIAIAGQGGGFLRYVVPPFEGIASKPKISFVRGVPDWQWYVGAGMYVEDLRSGLEAGQVDLKTHLQRRALELLPIFLSAAVLALAVSWLVYFRIRKERDIFSRFFKQAAEHHESIDENRLFFHEFRSLAASANAMLAAREKSMLDLQASERYYRSLIANMHEDILVVDRNYIITDVNNTFLVTTGHRREEVVGRRCFQITHRSNRPCRENGKVCGMEQVLESGHPQNCVHKHRNKDGSRVVADILYSPLKDENGNITHVIQAVRDVTDMARVKDELRQSEEKFRMISTSAQDAIVMFDPEGRVTYWNPAAERMFGFSGAEAVGADLRSLILPECKEDLFNRKIARFKESGGVRDRYRLMEIKATNRKLEELIVELSISAVTLDNRRHTIGIIRDISEKRRLEAQLRQTQKMEAIGTLAGGIAHDFNNILSAIIGYTELTMDLMPKDDSLRPNLDEVFNAGMRARDLVKQILTFSRQSEQELLPVQVSLIVKESLKLLKASLPATIEIRQKISSDYMVRADPTQIHQILMNLCTNAGYAMRNDGGILEVILTDEVLDAEAASADSGISPGTYVNLKVVDTGEGMPPDILEKVFDPFFSTKTKDEGTGLGLSVVQGIVKSHGGAISVSSEPGRGTRFTVCLPAIEPDLSAGTRNSQDLPTGTEHILLVDDEKALAHLNREMLSQLGYTVTARTSSMDALELFKSDPEQFDLVITDMTMPHMTGDRLAEEMDFLNPSIPIIMCTGFNKFRNRGKSAAPVVREILMKPVSRTDLALAVRKVLDETRHR